MKNRQVPTTVLYHGACFRWVPPVPLWREPEAWNGSGVSRRPDGWLPEKSLHSSFHFVERSWKKEPWEERKAKRVIEMRKKGNGAWHSLEGISPVGAASGASTLKPSGKSLPGICWPVPRTPATLQTLPVLLSGGPGLCTSPSYKASGVPSASLGLFFLALPEGK